MKFIATPWRKALMGATLGLALGAASVAQAATTITVWCWDAEFNGAAMNRAGERYAKLHPDVTVDVVNFGYDDLATKLQTQLASGSSEGLPDIVLVEDYNIQKYLQSFPGAFEPLNDKIDMTSMAPYKIALATHEGMSYSMPFDTGVGGMFYRSDLMEQAGYKASDLADLTWDQLIEIGVDFNAKTGKHLLTLDPNDSRALRGMLQSAGTWYFDAVGQPAMVGNPIFKTALETLVRMYQSPTLYVNSGSGGIDTNKLMNSGDVAAITIAVWYTGQLKSNPDLVGKWALAPYPKLDGVEGAGHATNIGGSSWYVPAAAANKDVAIDFLKTVWASDVSFYEEILVSQGAVGSLLAARDSDAYKLPDPFFGDQSVWQEFASWMAQIPQVNYGTFTSEAEDAIKAQLPGLVAGGNIDEAIAAIDSQVRLQIQ